jgi:two-component system, chemotaxis family, CheB/CheR fusion protein
LDKKLKLFQRLEVERDPDFRMPSSYRRDTAPMTISPKPEQEPLANASYPVQRAILDVYAPPAVVVNAQGDILYYNGRTGKFLESASGKPGHNLLSMAREGLRDKLGPTIATAQKNRTSVTVENLKVKSNGHYTLIDLTVQPLNEPRELRGMLLVVFEEIPEPDGKHPAKKKAAFPEMPPSELHEELNRTKQQLQSTVEEMEATQEELRSANEELQSNNEELQSTNEELTTAKEELQSLNEEMQTVNAELQMKIELLSQSNNDMKNLLNGIDIATIFLDGDLCIKRFTPQAVKIVNFIAGDVGRPFANLVTNLKYDRLIDDVREVLDRLVPKEVQVQTNDDRWYNMRVLPYRTDDNVIDGVVITLVEITNTKLMEGLLRLRQDELHESRIHTESILSAIRQPLLVLDHDQRIVTASRTFYDVFCTLPQNTVGQGIYDLDRGQWDIPELRQALQDIVQLKREEAEIRIERDFPSAGHRAFRLSAERVAGSDHSGSMILLTMAMSEQAPCPEPAAEKKP